MSQSLFEMLRTRLLIYCFKLGWFSYLPFITPHRMDSFNTWSTDRISVFLICVRHWAEYRVCSGTDPCKDFGHISTWRRQHLLPPAEWYVDLYACFVWEKIRFGWETTDLEEQDTENPPQQSETTKKKKHRTSWTKPISLLWLSLIHKKFSLITDILLPPSSNFIRSIQEPQQKSSKSLTRPSWSPPGGGQTSAKLKG